MLPRADSARHLAVTPPELATVKFLIETDAWFTRARDTGAAVDSYAAAIATVFSSPSCPSSFSADSRLPVAALSSLQASIAVAATAPTEEQLRSPDITVPIDFGAFAELTCSLTWAKWVLVSVFH